MRSNGLAMKRTLSSPLPATSLSNRLPVSDPTKLPRYTYERMLADGTPYWVWNPPTDAKQAGFEYEKLAEGDELRAIKRANNLNDELDNWRMEKRGVTRSLHEAVDDDHVQALMETYFNSAYFDVLSDHTKPRTRWSLEKAGDVVLDGTPFKHWKIDTVSPKDGDRLYYQLIRERGEVQANHAIMRVKRLFNIAIRWGYIQSNPFSGIMMKQSRSRRVKWTEDQLERFIQTAMIKELWKSVGIAAMIGHETGLKVTEIRVLEWHQVNFEKHRLELSPSRHGKVKFVPLSERIVQVLHQRYEPGATHVIANPRTGRPFEATYFSKTAQRIRDAAGLPGELRLADLRPRATA